jgi:molybdopterin-guanine dinucleotide biosynthesis protein
MILAVGGHSRNIGKTSVAAAIIRGFPEAGWTAIKITQHGHGICSDAGVPCHCADVPDHPFALDQETAPNASDSGRFLEAGAKRSFWLRTAQNELAYGLPSFREILQSAENVIVESNSLLGFVRADLYIAVLNYSVMDFKDSARRFLDRADALVIVKSERAAPLWSGVSGRVLASAPQFEVSPPAYFSAELEGFLRPYVASGMAASRHVPARSDE